MPQTITDLVLSDTYTPTAALHKLSEWKEAASFSIFGGQKPTSPADPRLKGLITKENINSLFETAEKEIKEIEVLTLNLPVEFPEEELTKIGQTLRQSFGPRFLFEVRINPSFIGGLALVWKGILNDYSLRQKILDNKEEILATLKQYIKH